MNDTKLILFTMLYTLYIDRDRELATKMNVNNINIHYSKWLSENNDLVGYDDVTKSMDEFISTKCFM